MEGEDEDSRMKGHSATRHLAKVFVLVAGHL